MISILAIIWGVIAIIAFVCNLVVERVYYKIANTVPNKKTKRIMNIMYYGSVIFLGIYSVIFAVILFINGGR